MGKKGRRSGTCVFCGMYGRLSREDATPKWLGRFVNEHLPPEERWEALEITFGDQKVPRQRSTFVGSASVHKPIVVCPNCNNGWMSRMENEIRQILKPLILGTPNHLDERSMLLLATWATKTALVYEFVLPEQDGTTASASDRKRLSEYQQPLPNSRIWLARYTGSRGAVIVARRTLFLYDLDDPTPTPEAHGLFVVLVYGQMALRIALPRSRPTYPTRFALWEGPHTQVLWPNNAPMSWPPTSSLDDALLDAYMSVQTAANSGAASITRQGRPPTG